MSRVVIIGGSGHVGTYLVPRLVEAGHEVINVSRGQRKAYTPNAAWSRVKTVSVDFDRRPAVRGIVAFVAASGETTIADAQSVTALRTGAVVGVATDVLASPGATKLVLIGLGGQAADQLRAVRTVRPIRNKTPMTLVVIVVRRASHSMCANCSIGIRRSPSALVMTSGSFSVNTIPKSTTGAVVVSGSAAMPWRVNSSNARASSVLYGGTSISGHSA